MSLAFMIKAHSSQDCRSIRILSIKMGLAYAIMNTNNQVENLHDHFDHFQYLSEMGGGGGGGEWVSGCLHGSRSSPNENLHFLNSLRY